MTLYIKQTLADGATVIADNTDDEFEEVLRPGQYAGLTAAADWYSIPHEQQQQRVRDAASGNSENADPQADTSATDRNDPGGPDAGKQQGNP